MKVEPFQGMSRNGGAALQGQPVTVQLIFRASEAHR